MNSLLIENCIRIMGNGKIGIFEGDNDITLFFIIITVLSGNAVCKQQHFIVHSKLKSLMTDYIV